LPLGAQVGLKLLRVTSEESAHSERVTSLAFSPDGKTLLSGSHDKSIAAWDAAPEDAQEGALS
jgi:WD40 repeat protein